MGKKSQNSGAMQAAQAQGELSNEAAREANYANRPDQYNPWGSLTWGTEEVIDPATGEPVTKWTQTQGMSGDAQLLYDQQMGLMGGRGEMAAGMNDRIRNEMGGAVNWNQFGNIHGNARSPQDIQQDEQNRVNAAVGDPNQIRQQAEDAAYGRATSRLDPRFAQSDEALKVNLRNKGLRVGDQAYDTAMANASREKTDAYQQAQYGASEAGRGEANQMYNQRMGINQAAQSGGQQQYGQQMGSTEMANALRDQQIQEQLAKRNFSLNEQNALTEGQDLKSLSSIAGG